MSGNNILVINCGSSSLKFSLINAQTENVLLAGLAEKLHGQKAIIHIAFANDNFSLPLTSPYDHQSALLQLVEFLQQHSLVKQIMAVGHRVVHGGEKFSQPTLINDSVLEDIASISALAPLHNPANLQGIRACTKPFHHLKQVAVFDTAFHQTLPEKAYLYGLPFQLYKDSSIRKYGFHGTSHYYVANHAAKFLNKPLEQSCLITAHLGNGCSVTAIKQGKSVDTSLGMTPIEGLIMGTRCGDLDPGIIFDLVDRLGYSLNDIKTLLNKQSGLLGISGLSNDCRELELAANQGNTQALLALDIFSYKAAKTIASFTASLTTLDAIVFTGGIGENSATIRTKIMQHLTLLNVKEDTNANFKASACSPVNIATNNSLPCLVIKTNEELVIAQQTQSLIGKDSTLCQDV